MAFGKLQGLISGKPITYPAQQLVNDAELRYMVKDIPSIPMFARPLYTIAQAKVKGVAVNPTQEGSPWNVSDWAA